MNSLKEQRKFTYQLSESDRSKIIPGVALNAQIVVFVESNVSPLDDVGIDLGDVRRLTPDSVEVIDLSAGEARMLVYLLSGQYLHVRLKFDIPYTLREDVETRLSPAWQRLIEFNAVANVEIDEFLDLTTGVYLENMFNVYAVMKFDDKLKLSSGN